MPWTNPTLQERRERIRQDFLAWTNTGLAPLRRSVENVYSYVLAGAAHALGSYIGWVAKQSPPNEDSDIDSILRWANDFLTVPQKQVAAATGSVVFTGDVDTIVPSDLEVTSLASGVSYTTNVDGIIAGGGTATLPVTATTVGADGNLEAGSTLYLGEPVDGLDPSATVEANGITGGADTEDALGVLGRLRDRFKNPPAGGRDGDYVAWATDVAGVTRAYVSSPDPKYGWLKVIVVDDDILPSLPGLTPIGLAQTNIDENRPVHMGGVVVIAPTPQTLDLTWSQLQPDEPGVRSAMQSAVNQWIYDNSVPGETVNHTAIENAAQAVDSVFTVSLIDPIENPDPGQYGMFTTINHTYE